MAITQPATFHSFPSDFENDTRFVAAALAGWNMAHGTALRFCELSVMEQSVVLLLAQKLKKAEARP